MRCFSSSAVRLQGSKRAAQDLADGLSEQMALNKEACAAFADGLDISGRRQLLRALVASETGGQDPGQGDDLERLFKAHDVHSPHGLLEKYASFLPSFHAVMSITII